MSEPGEEVSLERSEEEREGSGGKGIGEQKVETRENKELASEKEEVEV